MSGIDVRIEGTDRLIARLSALSAAANVRVGAAVAAETETLRITALDRMAALFRNQGGAMRNTLSTDVQQNGQVTTGTLMASGLPYLAIQEYGGTVMTPDIWPQNGLALAWASPAAAFFSRGGGGAATDMIFAKHTRAHLTKLPERSFLRYALATRRGAIMDAIAVAVRGANATIAGE